MRWCLVLAVALGGCLAGPGVSHDPGLPGADHRPLDAACPLVAEDNRSALRVLLRPDPESPHDPGTMAPYEQGEARAAWRHHAGYLERKPPEPEGCVVFQLDPAQVPVDVYVSIPTADPACSWIGGTPSTWLPNRTEHLVADLWIGCH